MSALKNKLYYGDCLDVMKNIPLRSVDLIYLDPPFNSQQSYNTIYKDREGRSLPEQVNAFDDMWEMTNESRKVLRNMPQLVKDAGIESAVAEFWQHWMKALEHVQPNLLAYLLYMAERLLILKTLLKPIGSIYLHCDSSAGHYIKMMLDGIFGHKNFRNEIIWQRTSAHSGPKQFGRISDTIFFLQQQQLMDI